MKRYTLLFLVLIFSGCSKESPVAIVEQPVVLFPLVQDNLWSYQFQTLKLNGVPDTLIDTSQYYVAGKSFGGYFTVQYSTTFQTTILDYLYKNSDSGIWIYNTNTSSDEFFLKFPSDSGDSHNWRQYTVETISKDTSIVTDTGTFSCYHFHLSTGDSSLNLTTQHIDYFFSINFGLVQQLNRTFAHNEIQGGSIQTLIGYQIKR